MGRTAKKQSGFTNRCQKHKFRKGLVIAVVILILVTVSSIGFAIVTVTRTTSKTTDIGFKNIGELATQAAYFTNIQTVEKAREVLGITVPFTDSKYIFSYDGVIKAGIDFSKVEVNVDDETKQITVYMPEVMILSIELNDDSLVVYDQSESIYTPLRIEDVNSSISEMKSEAKEKAIANGLLENAKTNAELLIRNFIFQTYDEESGYTVVFEYDKPETEE